MASATSRGGSAPAGPWSWGYRAPITIAVMGPVGSGKSTFVKAITKREDIQVGHGLMPGTNVVKAYPVDINSSRFVLLDTPGFDDTELTNAEVVERIAEFLEGTRPKTILTGIIYLYRINDNRLQGSSQSTFRIFHKLCGEDFCQNVILATTFWDKVDEHVGVDRERQLRDSTHWSQMLGGGATIARIKDYTATEPLLMHIGRKSPKQLLMQQKLATGNATLSDVVSSIADSEEMKRLKAQQREERQAQLAQWNTSERLESEKKDRLSRLRKSDSARRLIETEAAIRREKAAVAKQLKRREQERDRVREEQRQQERINVGLRNELRLQNERRARLSQHQAVARLDSTSGCSEGSTCCWITCFLVVVGIVAVIVVSTSASHLI